MRISGAGPRCSPRCSPIPSLVRLADIRAGPGGTAVGIRYVPSPVTVGTGSGTVPATSPPIASPGGGSGRGCVYCHKKKKKK